MVIGISLRNQGYLADAGYLVWLNSSGQVMRTGPGIDFGNKDEVELGKIEHFNNASDIFFHFDVSMNENNWSINVENVQKVIAFDDIPDNFSKGRILFQAYRCRAIIKNMVVEEI